MLVSTRSTDTSATSLVFLLSSYTTGSTLIFIGLQVVSANRHFPFSATTLFGVDMLALSPVNSLASTKTIKVAWVQICSSISSTDSLLLISAFAFSENFRVIDFIVSADSVILFSNFSTFHQALVSVSLVVNTTNRDISLMALAVGSNRRTRSSAEEVHFGALEITKIIVSYSVDSTNSVEKALAVFTSSRLWVRAFSIVKFRHTSALQLTFVFIGLSVHTTDWLVESRTTAVSDTRALILKSGFGAVHHTEGLVSDVVLSTYWSERERT